MDAADASEAGNTVVFEDRPFSDTCFLPSSWNNTLNICERGKERETWG
jgi:hypothetical protein